MFFIKNSKLFFFTCIVNEYIDLLVILNKLFGELFNLKKITAIYDVGIHFLVPRFLNNLPGGILAPILVPTKKVYCRL
jgi:hypothetical protein